MIDPQARIEQIEKLLREKLSGPQYHGIHTAVLLGEPAHGIANYAQEKHAELIVIPSHGRTGITRLLIGSVAERVVRLARRGAARADRAAPRRPGRDRPPGYQ